MTIQELLDNLKLIFLFIIDLFKKIYKFIDDTNYKILAATLEINVEEIYKIANIISTIEKTILIISILSAVIVPIIIKIKKKKKKRIHSFYR